MVATTRAPRTANPYDDIVADEALPEHVYRDPATKQLMRVTFQHTGFEDADGRRLATPDDVELVRRNGGAVFETHKEIPRPCVLPKGRTADEIDAERKAARLADLDFLHPTLGWLAFGRKREREAPENRGTGSIQRRVRRAPVNVEPPLEAVPHDGTGVMPTADLGGDPPLETVEPDQTLPFAPVVTSERRGPGRPRMTREEG